MDIRLTWKNRVFIFEAVSDAGREFLNDKGKAEGYIPVAPGLLITTAGAAVPVIEGIVRKGLEVN